MLSEVSAKDFALIVVCLYEEQNKNNQTMKSRLLLPILLVALSLISAFSQNPPDQPSNPSLDTFSKRVALAQARQKAGEAEKEAEKTLTKFSLDFPGGTPQQLVTAIEKATGKPLNAIISTENAGFNLPPLKMNNVNAYQLFEAVEATSRKTEKVVTGTFIGGGSGTSESYQFFTTSYGFRTPNPNGISDDSIWYFYVEKPARPPQNTYVAPKVCRFYPLTSYLERGLTVDDITTAIQTGWKMLGDQETPTISFHKETKLLIAVGELSKLETIDAVLTALQKATPSLRRLLPVVPGPEIPKTEN